MGEPGTEPWLIRHRIVVRFSDCDPLGHVNNARYSTYLEETRIVLWRRQAGIELRRAAQTGGPAGQKREGFILARAEIDFRSQAHDGDELEIRLALEGFGRTSATYRYEIVMAGTGRVVASARTVQVWYDYDAGKPVPLTERTRELLATSVSDRK
ncbi:MAG TPA: thioesterase family protein [Vicinamibacterales bacterium]|nr:thioesterase family protein [Vicinamibacterales bacterium]